MISLADRPFNGPFPLNEWSGGEVAAVYTLLVLDGAQYRPVFVGETPNFLQRAFPPARRGMAGWLALADYQQCLYIAVHPLFGQTERKALEREMIQAYQPECNEAFTARSLLIH